MNTEAYLHIFHRWEVEICDVGLGHFLDIYGVEKIPLGRQLQAKMNSLTMRIEGFDDDPRELFCIPEVRDFYSRLLGAWPYWLYFCSLDSRELVAVAMSCLQSVEIVEADQHNPPRLRYSPRELGEFVFAALPAMNEMCERSEMSELQIYERSKEVFAYFGIPFNSPPPGA